MGRGHQLMGWMIPSRRYVLHVQVLPGSDVLLDLHLRRAFANLIDEIITRDPLFNNYVLMIFKNIFSVILSDIIEVFFKKNTI